MMPQWLYESDDGVYLEGCKSESDWFRALEEGAFAVGWKYESEKARRQLDIYG